MLSLWTLRFWATLFTDRVPVSIKRVSIDLEDSRNAGQNRRTHFPILIDFEFFRNKHFWRLKTYYISKWLFHALVPWFSRWTISSSLCHLSYSMFGGQSQWTFRVMYRYWLERTLIFFHLWSDDNADPGLLLFVEYTVDEKIMETQKDIRVKLEQVQQVRLKD